MDYEWCEEALQEDDGLIFISFFFLYFSSLFLYLDENFFLFLAQREWISKVRALRIGGMDYYYAVIGIEVVWSF